MAKRLSDTNKYKKKFIRSLPGAYKLLWDYICLDCDHAGIWEVDFEVAQLRIGSDMLINEKKAIELFNAEENKIIVLNGGSKWFIRPFIDFQYGRLDPNNRVHSSVLRLLAREGIKGLVSPLDEAKDMAKDKDKDKDKDKEDIREKYAFLKDTVFKKAFEDYLAGRKKKATDRAKELILMDLHKHNIQIAIKMLEQSIKNGWVGVFELKEDKLKFEQYKTPRQSQVRKDPKPNKDCTNCSGTGKFKLENGKISQCWCVS